MKSNFPRPRPIRNENRIEFQIAAKKHELQVKLVMVETTGEILDDLSATLDVSYGEWTAFYEVTYYALALNKITDSEAETIIQLLGHSPETFNKLDVAEKIVLTQIYRDLQAWERDVSSPPGLPPWVLQPSIN